MKPTLDKAASELLDAIWDGFMVAGRIIELLLVLILGSVMYLFTGQVIRDAINSRRPRAPVVELRAQRRKQ